VVKGLEIGANDYIQKPFNQKELLARVKTHLSLQKAHDIQNLLISEDDLMMIKKLTYKELEQRIWELESEIDKRKQADKARECSE